MQEKAFEQFCGGELRFWKNEQGEHPNPAFGRGQEEGCTPTAPGTSLTSEAAS